MHHSPTTSAIQSILTTNPAISRFPAFRAIKSFATYSAIEIKNVGNATGAISRVLATKLTTATQFSGKVVPHRNLRNLGITEQQTPSTGIVKPTRNFSGTTKMSKMSAADTTADTPAAGAQNTKSQQQRTSAPPAPSASPAATAEKKDAHQADPKKPRKPRPPMSADVKISKALSSTLRHNAAKEGLTLREDGYARVDDLVCLFSPVKPQLCLFCCFAFAFWFLVCSSLVCSLLFPLFLLRLCGYSIL